MKRAWLKEMMVDVLWLGGAAGIVYGVALVSIPAAWVVGGVLAIALGGVIAMS